MEKPKDLDKLLSDLQAFLLILDWENLSFIAQAKKKSIAELLSRLQDPPSEDAEYMTMSCISTSGSSSRSDSASDPHHGTKTTVCPQEPPFSPSSRKPQEEEQATEESYEEAEPVNPLAQSSTGTISLHKSGSVDTDSSHYESYGEEEDCVTDRAHYIQWPPSSSSHTDPEPQICGFLWRKKWLGQWAKQLFLVRDHFLLCYRSAKDQQPLLELDLHSCCVTYKTKGSRKVQYKLKIAGATETLVIGFQSQEQAEEWRKVIEKRRSFHQAPSSNNSPVPPTADRKRNSHRIKSSCPSSESKEENTLTQPLPLTKELGKVSLGKSQHDYQVQGALQPQEKDFHLSQKALTLLENEGMRKGLDLTIGRKALPRLEQACRMSTRLKAGSEMNLLAIGKSLKQASSSISSAASEISFLVPILKRTASAKSSLKRTPSMLTSEKGDFFQRTKTLH
ncbi:actin filament-associated protein 1-like 2 isoform X2 [Rhinatrema bivittatum]|uniref:actin filament-associated protein 1-like 2 isoform X2 n=1 Tax=Rhinatrema bivittatum TaxID=194408 RepID=UPI001128B4D8|nr:actin filament-associated protein 1-like 2 isoform X2 [Rhinatrema bivittatum]